MDFACSARKQNKDDMFTHLHELATGKKPGATDAVSQDASQAKPQEKNDSEPNKKSPVIHHIFMLVLS